MDRALAHAIYTDALTGLRIEGWAQGWGHPESGPTCLGGHIARAAKARDVTAEQGRPLIAHLEQHVIRSETVKWNDAPGRTVDDVDRVLELCVIGTAPEGAR